MLLNVTPLNENNIKQILLFFHVVYEIEWSNKQSEAVF